VLTAFAAGSVACSRLYLGVHDIYQVIAGAVLGSGLGLIFLQY